MSVTASAPGKVILLGEHFVVYGEPAIVLAIDRRAYVTVSMRDDDKIYIKSMDIEASGYFAEGSFSAEVGGEGARAVLEPVRRTVEEVLKHSGEKVGVNVTVRSDIPVAAGLGSSAAVAVATAGAVSKLLNANLTRDEIFHVAYEAEKLIHGTPSGVDPAISTYGGVILYRRGEGIKNVDVRVDIPLVIGNTGVSRSTGKLVAGVGMLRRRHPSIINPIIKAGGLIVEEALKALVDGDLETLGELMNINHGLLYSVGVSSKELDRLIYAARGAGALGAKLTGAGGGGCMVALTRRERLIQVADAVKRAGGEPIIAGKTDEGVRVEG